MSITDTVFSGGLLPAVPLAMLAALVSFASPCVLPLVPGYLGYVGGMVTGAWTLLTTTLRGWITGFVTPL